MFSYLKKITIIKSKNIMKKLKLILLAFAMIFISNTVFSQSQPKVIAVLSRANWCPTCVKNDPRILSEVAANIDKTQVEFIVNDLTNKETKIKSLELLTGLGLEKLKLKTTGIITFIDPVTKQIISNIKVSKPTEEIQNEIKKISKT